MGDNHAKHNRRPRHAIEKNQNACGGACVCACVMCVCLICVRAYARVMLACMYVFVLGGESMVEYGVCV